MLNSARCQTEVKRLIINIGNMKMKKKDQEMWWVDEWVGVSKSHFEGLHGAVQKLQI